MKQQNCKLGRIRGKWRGYMKAAAWGILTMRDSDAHHMVDMDSVSSVTEGGLNSRKKNDG